MMKYAAAILTVLALAGTCWAVVAVMRPIQASVQDSDTLSSLNQRLKSVDREVHHLNELEGTLDQVNRLSNSRQSSPVVLALYASQSQIAVASKSTQPIKPDISLVYVSPNLQKVVINGRLYGTGDRLPNGGRLIAISQERIVIVRHGHRKVLPIPKTHVLGMASN